MQAPGMNRATVIVATAALLLPGISSTWAASKTPGRIGVYARLYKEAASPDKLREAMKLMKSVGIDFIIPCGKGSDRLLGQPDRPQGAGQRPRLHGANRPVRSCGGLEGVSQFCVCTEGGESGPNAVLKRNPSWAFFYDGARRGYIDPGNADARHYEVSLISELVSKYDVDGLSLDYCRCPNRVGYTDTGRAEFLKKHNVDLAKIAGAGPETLDTEGGKKAATFDRRLGARQPDLAGVAEMARPSRSTPWRARSVPR